MGMGNCCDEYTIFCDGYRRNDVHGISVFLSDDSSERSFSS